MLMLALSAWGEGSGFCPTVVLFLGAYTSLSFSLHLVLCWIRLVLCFGRETMLLGVHNKYWATQSQVAGIILSRSPQHFNHRLCSRFISSIPTHVRLINHLT